MLQFFIFVVTKHDQSYQRSKEKQHYCDVYAL